MDHSNIPETDWKKVKTEIQKMWGGLSSEELEKTHGDVSKISSLVQKRFGLAKKEAESKLDDVIERCGTSSGPASISASSKNSGDAKESETAHKIGDPRSSKKMGDPSKTQNR